MHEPAPNSGPAADTLSSLPGPAGQSRPLEAHTLSITLPTDVTDRQSFGRWLQGTLPSLIEEITEAFHRGLAKVPTLSENERERLEWNLRFAVHELLVNAVCYGLGGMTSAQRVQAYVDVQSSESLDQALRAALTDTAVRARVASVGAEVYRDKAVLTMYDGTLFADFQERWSRAPEALLEENLERPHGRGFLLLQGYGFTAEQAPNGAVIYSLKFHSERQSF